MGVLQNIKYNFLIFFLYRITCLSLNIMLLPLQFEFLQLLTTFLSIPIPTKPEVRTRYNFIL